MNRIATVASLALAVAGVSFTANAQDAADRAQQTGDRLQGRTERAGESAERAAERAGNEMQRDTDRVGDRANDAGRDLNRNMNQTGRAADRADIPLGNGDGVASPNGTAAAPDAEGIRDVLVQVSETSLAADAFDDLVERFVDADRNRIGKWMKDNNKDDFDDLNAKSKVVLDKFKAKYNDDEFEVANEEAVITQQFATITQSEIGDDARTAGSRETVRTETRVDRTGDRDAGDAARDAGRAVGDAAKDVGDATKDAVADTGVDNPNSNAADSNRNDPGRNIATVKVNQSHGLPALTVEMIHEFPGVWKIDVPDQVSGQQLYDNVGKALDKIAADESKWPADKNEAYRYITHSLLLAIHGQNTGM